MQTLIGCHKSQDYRTASIADDLLLPLVDIYCSQMTNSAISDDLE